MNDDSTYMRQAIDLAWQGLYSASPNPRVGCVLVRNEDIIGKGYHLCAGQAHAEVNALKACKDAVGATAYVTLEPCSHTGKTPPCCEALIRASVARVVVAMQDPNPKVAGNGIKALREAGIRVDVGVLEREARALNPGFIKRMDTAQPYVTLKLAMSLDGRTAMANGESQWITGPDARSDVQRLRARSCAIVSGVDTIIQDDASLTVRADELGLDPSRASLAVQHQPLRVVLDSHLRLPATARILCEPGKVLIAAVYRDQVRASALEAAGAGIIYLDADDGRVDLAQLLKGLAERQCNEVLVEAGATLAGSFWRQALVDQLTVYMAPTLMGSDARALLDLPLQAMAEQQRLQIDAITPIGEDWRLDARPVVV